jgi:hypothetical protein
MNYTDGNMTVTNSCDSSKLAKADDEKTLDCKTYSLY